MAPVNASNDRHFDGGPLVSDQLIIWRSFANGSSQVVRATPVAPTITQTITLLVNGDTRLEPDETFFLNLSSPTLAVLDNTQATITILNDDGSLDYGTAPDPTYPTLLADDGARHSIVPGIYLGSKQGVADGVVFNTPMVTDQTATVTVTASVAGYSTAGSTSAATAAWADWTDCWGQTQTDHVFVSQAVSAGANTSPSRSRTTPSRAPPGRGSASAPPATRFPTPAWSWAARSRTTRCRSRATSSSRAQR